MQEDMIQEMSSTLLGINFSTNMTGVVNNIFRGNWSLQNLLGRLVTDTANSAGNCR
jgi:hypothetical protein